MAKQDKMEMEGTVTKNLKGDKFEVKLDVNEHVIVAKLSGKLRINYIRIIPGDRVKVEISPYDLNNGIITWRYKNAEARE